jgi:hypothetical protein
VKVLKRTLGQVLPFWDLLRTLVFFDKDASNAALAEIDSESKADRPAPDNDHLR